MEDILIEMQIEHNEFMNDVGIWTEPSGGIIEDNELPDIMGIE